MFGPSQGRVSRRPGARSVPQRARGRRDAGHPVVGSESLACLCASASTAPQVRFCCQAQRMQPRATTCGPCFFASSPAYCSGCYE
eukprot:scaffold4449_cov93-Isochrysis_galbana.AAC.3